MLQPLALLLALAPALEIKSVPGSLRVEVRAPLEGRLLDDVPQGRVPSDQGERWLRFCLLDPATGQEGLPMLGTYRRDRDVLSFVPRHALSPGQRYRAILELGGGRKRTAEYRAPAAVLGAPAVVEKVYPTADVLPANQLKFYVHFSRPMRETRAIFDQVHLLDDQGKAVGEAWQRTELWSADARRLTLLIHPGRVKRGIEPREQQGPVLWPNRKYTLVITAKVADVSGQPLGKDFTKSFRTAPEDRFRPLPEKWSLRAPRAGTTAPLVVEFPEPLDRALLDRFLTVKDGAGKEVVGRIEVGKEERSWLFHPERTWTERDHHLEVAGDLEDLAGNTPLRLFDVDLDEATPAPPQLNLRFRPRP